MIATRKHTGYAFISMPNGTTARIPIERPNDEPFDKEEATEFEQAVRHRGHHNLLALLNDLKHQGLSPQQATDVACEYLNLLDQQGRG